MPFAVNSASTFEGHLEQISGLRLIRDMKKFAPMTAAELRAARQEMQLTQPAAAERYQLPLRTYKAYELGEFQIPGPVKVLTQYFLEEFRKKS